MEKVKITKKDLMLISTSLRVLASRETPAWYQITRNQRIVEKPVKEIYAEKQLIFDKLAEKDDNGNFVFLDESQRQIKFKEGKEKEADELWDTLQNEIVEIEFYQFSASKFGNIELNPGLMEPLLDIIITE